MAITEINVEDLSKAPKRVRTEEGTVEEKPVEEMIQADRYNAAKQATAVPWGLRMARIKPGGTIPGA